MALFSDVDIEAAIAWKKVEITPFNPAQLQPCSYDVRLGEEFLAFERLRQTHIDPRTPPEMVSRTVADGEGLFLEPGQFVLGSTLETIALGPNVAARFEGKSSIGRLGLLTHCTAAFVDAGWVGQITLELANVSGLPLKLWPGMKIGQLCFFDLLTPSRQPYGAAGNHYQGQRGPTASRSHLQFEENVA